MLKTGQALIFKTGQALILGHIKVKYRRRKLAFLNMQKVKNNKPYVTMI